MTQVNPDPRSQLSRLWRAAFGEPPAIDAEPEIMAQVLIRCLPCAPPYEFGAGRGKPPEGGEGGEGGGVGAPRGGASA